MDTVDLMVGFGIFLIVCLAAGVVLTLLNEDWEKHRKNRNGRS